MSASGGQVLGSPTNASNLDAPVATVGETIALPYTYDAGSTLWRRALSNYQDGLATGFIAASQPALFTGAGSDRARTPNIFKALNAVVVTAETTIWTPAAGKKFRLMGLLVAVSAAAGGIFLKDNTGGTTIVMVPALAVNNVVSMALGNGILSAAANNVLTAQGSAGEAITGVVFGTEE